MVEMSTGIILRAARITERQSCKMCYSATQLQLPLLPPPPPTRRRLHDEMDCQATFVTDDTKKPRDRSEQEPGRAALPGVF